MGFGPLRVDFYEKIAEDDPLGMCCADSSNSLRVKSSLEGEKMLDTIAHEACHAAEFHNGSIGRKAYENSATRRRKAESLANAFAKSAVIRFLKEEERSR